MLIGHQRPATRSGRLKPALYRSAGRWQSLFSRANRGPCFPPGHGHRRLAPDGHVEDRQGRCQGTKRALLVIGLSFLFLACVSCSRNQHPQAAFDRAYKALLHGDLKQTQNEAHRECQRFRNSSPEWAWKFRTLEARAALQQGLYEDALKLLKSAPLPSDQADLVIPILALAGEANVKTHNFSEAERSLNDGDRICATSLSAGCGYSLKARGLLSDELNQSSSAEQLYELSLAFARARGDALLEAYALLNLGAESLAQGRFDEAIDRSQAAYQAAKAVGARRLQLITQGNIGWAYY